MGIIMTARLQYGGTEKVFHWLMVALLLVQYSIGWLMPDIHQGMNATIKVVADTTATEGGQQ